MGRGPHSRRDFVGRAGDFNPPHPSGRGAANWAEECQGAIRSVPIAALAAGSKLRTEPRKSLRDRARAPSSSPGRGSRATFPRASPLSSSRVCPASDNAKPEGTIHAPLPG